MNVKNREGNYDLLRILCMVGVIFIHVSHLYKSAIINGDRGSFFFDEHIVFVTLCNILPRCSVPCFVMLTGAFLLDDEKNLNYKYFYSKHIKKIVYPTVLFSLLYVLFNEAQVLLKIYQTQGGG